MKKLAIIALLAGIVCSQAHAADTIFDLKSYFTTKYRSAISFFWAQKMKDTPVLSQNDSKPAQTSQDGQDPIFGTFLKNEGANKQSYYSDFKRFAYLEWRALCRFFSK